MHLIIATRVDPEIPLPRFRGRGAMLEIGADDLRFTLDEAAALLQGLQGTALSPEDVSALNERTEGWAVGLKMAALSLRGQKDIRGFLASFTGSQRYIMDYLIEEVLRRKTPEIRDFLMKTSILERLSGPLCDFITERKDGSDTILELEREHLFIVPLDESRQWCRYHHLFAELLRHQLKVTYGAKEVARLHQRASQWYQTNGSIDDTMYHALEAKDWEKAVNFFMENHMDYFTKGMWVTLLNWLQKMPEEVIYRDSRLSNVYGSVFYVLDQLDAATAVTNRMEKMAENNNVIHRGAIEDLRGWIAYSRGDFELSFELGEKALSLIPLNDSLWRASPSVLVGTIYMQRGLFKEAESLLSEGYRHSRQAGHDFLSPRIISRLAEISSMRGKLRLAAEQHRQAIELSGTLPGTALSYEFLSAIFYEWNQLEAAVTHIQRATERIRITGDHERLARENAMLAGYKLLLGDETGALKTLENACVMAHDNILPRVRAEHAVFHILMALRQDDLATALDWGRKFAEDAGTLAFYYNWVPIRLLIAEGKKPAALEKLQNLYQEALQRGAQSNLIVLRICQALAAPTQESALQFLVDALTMAEPEGYIRTFVDEGRLLAPLLRKALSEGIMPEYIAKLLAIIEAEERRRRATKGKGMLIASSPEFLSERELEVLRLVAEGFSNQQIADKLMVSLSTAKTHVHRLFKKLNARDRLQVVNRARELKLI